MHVTNLVIENVRSFEGKHSFDLSPRVNLFVGKNSSGKSTVLRCLHLLQLDNSDGGYVLSLPRKGITYGRCQVTFSQTDVRLRTIHGAFAGNGLAPWIECTVRQGNREFVGRHANPEQGEIGLGTNCSIAAKEPNQIFMPFFSKRKTQGFEQATDQNASFTITDNLRYLFARVARLANTDNEAHSEFVEYCQRILGFKIGAIPSLNGSEAGLWLKQTESISVSSMGEGTPNILALIIDLCVSENNIFLIEELENDIHPEALKALLELIAKKSQRNQFLISTHSNIVVRHLGADATTKIFALSMELKNRIPTTMSREVGPSETARTELLRYLGYEPFDFGLWRGYLLLEESSAEAVINRILIPGFAPQLIGKLRTISAGGIDCVEATYADFRRLFVFTHTSEIYQSRCWVRVDGDAPGQKIVASLKSVFSDSAADRFGCFNQERFEEYYPSRFREKAAAALQISSKQQRRDAKRALCLEVLEWAEANPSQAKLEFQTSAREVIDQLLLVQKQI